MSNTTGLYCIPHPLGDISFFIDKLGFVLDHSYGNPMYVAGVRRDETQCISLLCMPGKEVNSNTIATLVFQCQDIDSIYEEFLSNGVVIDEGIENKAYGVREFRIKDSNGYVFYFQERAERRVSKP